MTDEEVNIIIADFMATEEKGPLGMTLTIRPSCMVDFTKSFDKLLPVWKKLKYPFVLTYSPTGVCYVGGEEVPYVPRFIVDDSYTQKYKHENPQENLLKHFETNECPFKAAAYATAKVILKLQESVI